MITIAVFLLTGTIVGFLSGLFGVGGGIILVPVLAFMLPTLGVPPTSVMQTAIGTSLAVIAIHSISSVRAHQSLNGIVWQAFRGLAPGLILGSFAGAYVAHSIGTETLRRTVSIGAILIATQMMLDYKPQINAALPKPFSMAMVGVAIGAASALVGIGGGSMTVPFLTWRKVEVRKAVGTSAACGGLIAVAGAIGFACSGLSSGHTQSNQVGYVSIPGLICLASTSIMTSGYGARAAHKLKPQMLKRAFAVFLCIVAVALWAK